MNFEFPEIIDFYMGTPGDALWNENIKRYVDTVKAYNSHGNLYFLNLDNKEFFVEANKRIQELKDKGEWIAWPKTVSQ